MRIPLVLMLVLGLVLPVAHANGAESVVLSAAALKAALAARPPEGSDAGDSDKPITFGTAGAMHDAAVGGAQFDVVILTPDLMDDLVKRGLADPTSIRPLGTMRLGAAVARGVIHPLIDTADHFRTTLVDAKSVAIADPRGGATTGIYLEKLFASLGVTAILAPKLRVFPDGQGAMEAVAHGDAALGIGQCRPTATRSITTPRSSPPTSST